MIFFLDLADDEFVKIYWIAEKKCRKITLIMSTFIVMNQSVFMPPLIISFYNLYMGIVDTSIQLPFTIYVPFKIESMMRWYMLWFFQFSVDFGYGMSMSAPTSYFMSSCVYIVAICDHFNAIIDLVKKDIELNNQEKSPIERRRRYEKIKANLAKAVDIHVKIFE